MILNKLRALLKRVVYSDFVLNEKITDYPFDLKNSPKGYFRSLGNRNPDKIFYIIWRDNYGSGFFSNLQHVIAHLRRAQSLGMIPVIDFENFKTLYNEDTLIYGTLNSWEYYFKQVSPFNLEDVYNSQNVYFCDGSYSWSLGSYMSDSSMYQTHLKYIISQDRIVQKIDSYWSSFGLNNRVLGVHFRGKEQNVAAGHPFCPTKKQMYSCVDEIIKKYKINKIFIVTEDQDYLNSFVDRYGDLVLKTESFRTHKINAYKINPRPQHKYLLGEEVMIDSFLLSRCCGMLHSSSNVSEFARFINNNKFEFRYFIQNGVNSNNPVVAKYLYRIKKCLPRRLGGLLDKIGIYQNNKME